MHRGNSQTVKINLTNDLTKIEKHTIFVAKRQYSGLSRQTAVGRIFAFFVRYFAHEDALVIAVKRLIIILLFSCNTFHFNFQN